MSETSPTDEQVLAYAAGELDEATRALIAAELARDPAAAARVARYQAVAAIVRGDDSVAPPAAVMARAKAIFSVRPATTAPGPLQSLFDGMRRVVAELTFESGGAIPALAGFRGGGSGRQFVFEAEGTVVDLQVEPEAERRWRIMGQVETDQHNGGLVIGLAPLEADQAAIAVTTDAHGGFHFSAATGRYNIFVRTPNVVVVLPNLVLG